MDDCIQAFRPSFRKLAEDRYIELTRGIERVDSKRLYMLKRLGAYYDLDGRLFKKMDDGAISHLELEGIGEDGQIVLKNLAPVEVKADHLDDILYARENLDSQQISIKHSVDEYWRKVDLNEELSESELGFQFIKDSMLKTDIAAYQNELARLYILGKESGHIPEHTLKKIYQDLFKYEEINKVFRGESAKLPLSFLMSLPESVSLPKYYNAASARYSPIRVEEANGKSSLLYDASRMLEKDKGNFENLFASFVDHLYYDPMVGAYSKSYVKNFTYIDDDRVQYGFHAFNPRVVKTHIKEHGPKSVPMQYKNLARDIRLFVANEYKKRMGISQEDLDKLVRISEEAEDRTVSLVSAKEGYAEITYERHKNSDDLILMEIFEEKDFDRFNIDGAINAVYSRGAHEKLPLESFTGFKVPRLKDDEVLLEIGRLAVAGEVVGSEMFFRGIAALSRNVDNVSRVIIEADAARARMFKKFGFSPIHKRKNFEGKDEYIMEVSPDTLYKKISGLFIEK